MARFDLNGNPMSDGPAPPPDPVGRVAAGQRVDLSGNPLPPYSGGAPPPYAGPPPVPGQYGAMPGYSAPPVNRSPYRADEADRKRKITIGVVGGAAAVIVLVLLLRAMFPPPVPAVTGYAPYRAVNNTFSVAAPRDWGVSDNGKEDTQASSEVVLRNGTASIDIVQDSAAIGTDVAAAQKLMHDLYDQNKFRMTDAFANAIPDKPYTFATDGFGDGVCTPFTATGPHFGFAGSIQGYYVAIAGFDRTAVVVCQCRASDWNKLKPAFQHVINSLTEESGKPPGDDSDST